VPFKKQPSFLPKKTNILTKASTDIPFFKLLVLSFFINIVIILAIWILKSHIPPQVPLLYGLPEGEEQLTTTMGLTIPSFIALAIIVINTIVATIVENNFFRNSLVLTSFAVTIFTAITTIKIVLLVGSF
jgi:uncharacterized Tic20 family protein